MCNGALLIKPKIAVADLNWLGPKPWRGAVVTFTQGANEVEVGLTAHQCRRLAKSLQREADRAERPYGSESPQEATGRDD